MSITKLVMAVVCLVYSSSLFASPREVKYMVRQYESGVARDFHFGAMINPDNAEYSFTTPKNVEKSALMKSLLSVPGVLDANIDRYSVGVIIKQGRSWNLVTPKLMKVFSDYLNANLREVPYSVQSACPGPRGPQKKTGNSVVAILECPPNKLAIGVNILEDEKVYADDVFWMAFAPRQDKLKQPFALKLSQIEGVEQILVTSMNDITIIKAPMFEWGVILDEIEKSFFSVTGKQLVFSGVNPAKKNKHCYYYNCK